MSGGNSTWKWNKLTRRNKLDMNCLKKTHKEFIKNNRLMLKS